MHWKLRAVAAIAVCLWLAGGALAAPSLDVTKPPVTPATGSWTGPGTDPQALSGQWFLNLATGLEEVREAEFYDNEEQNGGGFASTLAIEGVVDPTSIVTGPAGEIIAFRIDATITNDTPSPTDWLAGDNSHGEMLQTTEQYEGTLVQPKLTVEFAIDAGKPPPQPGGPYMDEFPDAHIVAENHDQLAWYCWTVDNPDPDKIPWGDYYVPTWDFADIPPGGMAPRVLDFRVDGTGILPGDPRYAVILDSAELGLDILLNRTTSLKISTWLDQPAIDTGVPYPHLEEMLPYRSSDCSVFHDREEEPAEGGLSLDIRKPPVEPAVDAWTGPVRDAHALRGQWFLEMATGDEQVRTHEFYDPVEAGVASNSPAAIHGVAGNVQFDANQNITGFDLTVTITNNTPWPYSWMDGDNSHGEFLSTREQYEGTLYDVKWVAEFAIDPNVGFPTGYPYPYRDTDPHIVAIEPEQLAWYCWTPENPDPEKQPWGAYFVPTWDFGDIRQGASFSRTINFSVDGGGLPPADPRYGVITNSANNGDDCLLNRTTSLKISTWIDDIALDPGTPYPHLEDQMPLRSSDCSVFHNIEPEPEWGGLSLPVTKPEVLPDISWTGPQIDPHAKHGQWFLNSRLVEEFRTHEFYDNVPLDVVMPGLGSRAIEGYATNIQYDAAGANIVAFDIVATITNLTPYPYDWMDGSNSHYESLSTLNQYEGTLFDTKLTAEFSVADSTMIPPAPIPPYRDTDPHIVALDPDQLAWYCWTPENPEPDLVPWGQYYVPVWDFGDIPRGSSATRMLSFQVDGAGLSSTDPRFQAIVTSAQTGSDLLLNRSSSLKISTWIDDLAIDPGTPYPHLEEETPLRSSDVSVFHNTADQLDIAASLDWSWVYQNTPQSTAWRHKCVLAITIVNDPNGNLTYSSFVTQNVMSTGKVIIQPTANPLVWDILGGDATVPDPIGSVTLNVLVVGNEVGGLDTTTVTLNVRQLGDIDGNGFVNLIDKVNFNKRLNGMVTPYPDRCYDLTGDTFVNVLDKVIMNRALNGMPIP